MPCIMFSGCKRSTSDPLPATSIGPLLKAEAALQLSYPDKSLGFFFCPQVYVLTLST
jgi:hypothetical protein